MCFGVVGVLRTSRPSRQAVFTEYPTDEMGQEDHDMVTQQVFDPAILIILCNMFFISNTTYSQNPNNTKTHK